MNAADHYSSTPPHQFCPCCDALWIVTILIPEWMELMNEVEDEFNLHAGPYSTDIDDHDRVTVGGLAFPYRGPPDPTRISVWIGDKEVFAFNEKAIEKIEQGPWITELTRIAASFYSKYAKEADKPHH